MNNIITKRELWNYTNEQIAALTKGRFVRIVFTDGNEQEVYVKNISVSANPPHLFTGFLKTKEVFVWPLGHMKTMLYEQRVRIYGD